VDLLGGGAERKTMGESERIVGTIGQLANRHDAEAIQEHLAEDMEFLNP
jgi:hypothetical protein